MADVAVLQPEDMPKVEDFMGKDIPEGNSTAWIGFIDTIPVIGSVKESVELVLALYKDNNEVIKEKKKALEDFVTKHQENETSGDVKEVAVWDITKHVKQASKNQYQHNKTANEKKKIIEEIKEKYRQLLNICKEEGGKEWEKWKLKKQQTSNRGEHVFNNNILKFHSKVLKQFIEKHNVYRLPKYDEPKLKGTINSDCTVSSDAAKEIQTDMVVFCDPGEYIDMNADTYGFFNKMLVDAVCVVLDILLNTGKNVDTMEVTHILQLLNRKEIYVDLFAKYQWIGNDKQRQNRFDNVKTEVTQMYSTEKILNWCHDIVQIVKSWM